ncbi:MAG: M61 family metallopeptidase [Myxococcales bacterium]|nr:M61 family metallopeptidase [Myxococcales bacterium]
MRLMMTLAALLTAPSALAADPAPIRYVLRFPAAATHYVEVEATLPTDDRPQLEVMMPVWTPGSYLVREYARNVEDVQALGATGQALPVSKVRKNRWRIDQTGGTDAITLRYRVYGREMSVRTNWIERDFALLNGAATFMTFTGDAMRRPHEVTLEPAAGWRAVYTALPAHPDGAQAHYRAPDFDTLVDAPILAGAPDVQPFEVSGKVHQLITEGGGDVWDNAKAAADVARIVEAARAFWGDLPYDRYQFMNLLVGQRGGLEHRASTVIMGDRFAQRVRKDELDWLHLVCHEHFHAWNVKRLRPAELGPFDYELENHTRSLWIAEGITAYYDALLVRRAGLSTRAEYLEALSTRIANVQFAPGRLVRSLEEASFDAWIKHYRPDENSANTTISYYDKGAAVAFLLDARIRELTRGTRSLDDVMRAAYARFSGDRGYLTDEFYGVAAQVAGAEIGPWIQRAAGQVGELDYAPALAWYGLRFKTVPPDENPTGWLGVHTGLSDGRLVIRSVIRGTPAEQAGISVDDELVALDGYRIDPNDLADRLKRYRPGTQITALMARRQRLIELPVILGTRPPEAWNLEIDPRATSAQKARLDAWLGPDKAPTPTTRKK